MSQTRQDSYKNEGFALEMREREREGLTLKPDHPDHHYRDEKGITVQGQINLKILCGPQDIFQKVSAPSSLLRVNWNVSSI